MVKNNLLDFIGNTNNIIVPSNYHYYYGNNGSNKRILNKLVKNSEIDLEKIIFYKDDDKLIFVDGMERFTTIYILLCALSSKLYEIDNIEEYEYILNNYVLSENNYKLLNLRDKDDKDLKEIVNALCEKRNLTEYEYNPSDIMKTYNYFMDVLDQRPSSCNNQHYNIFNTYDDLYNSKCQIVYVPSQDVHKMFNQLNEPSLTHRYLCNVLIKNYFLDNLNYTHVSDFRSKWLELENIFSEYSFSGRRNSKYFDRFLKIYFTAKLDYSPDYKELYQVFCDYSENRNLKDIYEDIYKYAIYYNNMFHDCQEDGQLNTCFKNITKCCFNNRLDNKTYDNGDAFYSNEEMQVFLLKIYDDFQKSIITKEELTFITKTIESYVIRRDLCDITSDKLNQTFIRIYNQLNKKDYVNSFISQITSLKKDEVFPSDNKIRGELFKHDFYKETDINKYILDELENSYRVNPKDDLDDYHIEHIMPRTLSKEWSKYLGSDAEKIHDEYVNTIGNLTLLEKSANIALSNNSFHEKVNKKDIGYKYSDIMLSEDVINAEKWNEKSIKQRSAKMAEQIIKLWHYPEINNQIPIEIEDTAPEEFDYDNQLLNELDKKIISLDDNIQRENTNDYTEYKLNGYSLLYLHQKDEFIECRLHINEKNITPPDMMGKYYVYKDKIKCYIHDKSDISYTIQLIKQILPLAYDNESDDETLINDFKYPTEYYQINGEIQKLFIELQTRIHGIDSQIIQNNNKYSISFKINNQTIVEVYPNEEYLDLNINLPKEYLNKEELNTISNQDYYEKTINIFYENRKQTEKIIEIIKKAYQYITGSLTIKQSKEKQKYSLEYLGMEKGTVTRELFDQLNRNIQQIDDLIQKNTSAYVAYKKDGKNLIYIYNEKIYLKVLLAVNPNYIPDELKIRGKYDEGKDFIVYVDEFDDIDNAMEIIKEAYKVF